MMKKVGDYNPMLSKPAPFQLLVTKRWVIAFLAFSFTFLYFRDLYTTNNLTILKYPKRNQACEHHSSSFKMHYSELVLKKPALDIAKEHHGVLRYNTHESLDLSWESCLPMHTKECGLYVGSESSMFDLAQDGVHCRSAVLHHLLTLAIDVIEQQGFIGVPSGPTLRHLAAFGALSPSNHSVEITTDANIDLSSWFWQHGLAHFKDESLGDITCIAAHHPLASKLYADDLPIVMGPLNGVPFMQWASIAPKTTFPGFEGEMNYIHIARSKVVIPRNYIFPLSCLKVYDVSIQAPHYAPAFYSNSQELESYPSSSCEAYCDTYKVEPKSISPNFSNCPIHRDLNFESRLEDYKAQNVPLQLSDDHKVDLEPFKKNETKLRAGNAWQYCLPIRPIQCGVRRGDKSTLFDTPVGRPCRSAVLHLLMDDLLDALSKDYQVAFPYFGTLLGAWRDQAIIPHTPDVDIVVPYQIDWDHFQDVMWERGYYVFYRSIHAACVAPHHPLAPLLYTPESSKTNSPDHGTPYVDLYTWWEVPDNGANDAKIHLIIHLSFLKMEAEGDKVHKRLQKRNQQREFRRKVNQQLELLRARAKELEIELNDKRKNRSLLLPWSQVEYALRNDLIECQTANKHLIQNIADMQLLNHLMIKWLRTLFPIVENSSEYPAWYRIGLCQDDASKIAICDWVTQHMYHNTDHVLMLSGFRSENHFPSQGFLFDTSKGYIEYNFYDRRIHHESFDIVLEAFRELFLTNNSFSTGNDSTILSKEYIYSRGHDISECLVHREFIKDNRVVFVQHSIQDDAKFPNEQIHRHKANWIVLELIAPNVVMETKVFQKSQSWTSVYGYFTPEEEAARIVGCEYHLNQLQRKEKDALDILREHSSVDAKVYQKSQSWNPQCGYFTPEQEAA
ncbi:hypothetical protein THRCLA_06102 [Thraustotheca clavata]|uniref:Uncharacterized protein n=1 Tax=Thraustotheca clavata TaxID=74557 RepID=A0A1V9ZQJ1_9STRA|nr:hypothetical protein THRCLA_06102 [Thraustotheca clavata]